MPGSAPPAAPWDPGRPDGPDQSNRGLGDAWSESGGRQRSEAPPMAAEPDRPVAPEELRDEERPQRAARPDAKGRRQAETAVGGSAAHGWQLQEHGWPWVKESARPKQCVRQGCPEGDDASESEPGDAAEGERAEARGDERRSESKYEQGAQSSPATQDPALSRETGEFGDRPGEAARRSIGENAGAAGPQGGESAVG